MLTDLKSYSAQKVIFDIGQGGIIAMAVFPLALAFGANSAVGITSSLFAAIIGGALLSLLGTGAATFAPTCLIFLIFSELLSKFGWTTALFSGFLAGVLLFIFSFFPKAKQASKIPTFLLQGFVVGATLSMAILQVTNYFEIGATGATAVEMLMSYKNVGFHSNWRTVLFATIMLVVMITFPIKFKRFSKIVSAQFFGIAITTILNLFLNADVSDTNVIEVGNIPLNLISGNALIFNKVSEMSIQNAIVGAVVIAFLINAESTINHKGNMAAIGACNIVSPLFGGMPLSVMSKVKGTRFVGLYAGIIMYVFIAVFGKFVARLPISVLATALIMVMWEQIDWKSVKIIFANQQKIKPIIFFSVAILTVLIDLTFAAIIIIGASIVLTMTDRIRGCYDENK